MTESELQNISWPISQLGDAMQSLARYCDLSTCAQEISNPPTVLLVDQPMALHTAFNEWMEAAADYLGFEAEPIQSTYAEIEKLAQGAGPALLRLPGDRILAVIKSGVRSLTVLSPDLKLRRASVETICSVFRRPHEMNLQGDVDRLLIDAGTPRRRLPKARASILLEQLGQRRISSGWLLRRSPGTGFWRQLSEAGLRRSLTRLIGMRIVNYSLLMTSWGVLGRGALNGHLDYGWLIAWTLLLLTAVPFYLVAEWMQGRFAIEAGARLKGRLLFGALRLQPEEIRHLGAGQFIGKIAESHAIESLALNGGFVTLSAAIEIVMAVVILGLAGASHFVWLQVFLLLCSVSLTILFARSYFMRRREWTETRAEMTHDLVERMVGHRTRLAQEAPGRWHEGEDRAIENYLSKSQIMDSVGTLQSMAPRIWLAAGLCGLAGAFVTGSGDTTAMAISIGGILLAYRGLQKLVSSLSALLGAAIAWKQISDVFNAAARPQENGSPDFVAHQANKISAEHGPFPYEIDRSFSAPNDFERRTSDTRFEEAARAQNEILVEAHDLTFRYQERGEPALRGCGLQIRAGDRMLLEGESGGGKSTLASLLTGLRTPESGLLLLGGLDRQTIGAAGWRKRVASAPQFHENHVLTGTFAFNLLMGRGWPPTEQDLAEAESICRALGMSDLLERMPAGLLQMVGETGWQLSHGERSRLFMARALLQNADLVILDESFGALDPATLRQCLQTALERARTLMVIAHP